MNTYENFWFLLDANFEFFMAVSLLILNPMQHVPKVCELLLKYNRLEFTEQ